MRENMEDNPSMATNRRPANFNGFVHAFNAGLVDGSGKKLLLRGVGLGNWLLPEGYMWKFGPGAESPREIEKLVSKLLGEEAAQDFWHNFRQTFICEDDIALISANGFDHVRLPINSRIIMTDDGLPIESGFELIDQLIEWCRIHNLWVLLDLHGAPGGQTGTNIDDSPNNMPELFMDKRYWNQTLEIWRLLASRYATESVVLGYDLLNEPIPNEWQYKYSVDLARLYREITAVIRSVDSNHLIVYEGSHWATNWDIFTEVWDANSLLQFHKYWSPPDKASIQKFLDFREKLGLPIYMGEGGENNAEWIYTAFRLYERYDIGWNFWTWKKIETVTSPLSVKAPSGWGEIRNFVQNGDGISQERAKSIFTELLHNFKVKNCTWNQEVVAALLAENPLVIPAWGFGFYGEGESYQAHRTHTLNGVREEDSVTLEYREGNIGGYNFEQTDGRNYLAAEEIIVKLEKGDWLEFDVDSTIELSKYRVETADGAASNISVMESKRGFKITAHEFVRLLRIRRIN